MKLLELEIKKHNVRAYLKAALIIAITMLALLYLLAYAPRLDPNDADMALLSGYKNLILLFSALNTAVFSVLSAILYTKLIIEAYDKKRIILLFSYPVSRKEVMCSKISVVSIFTISSMVAGSAVNLLIFGISNRSLHLVHEKFTFPIMTHAVETTLIMSIVAASIGIVSAGVGFINKSVPTTICTAVLISSFMCNIVFHATTDKTVMYLFTIVILFAAILSSIFLMKKCSTMEAE